MASRCIRADTRLQKKVPLGALVLSLGRRAAPLPRRLLRTNRYTGECEQGHYGHAKPRREPSSIGLVGHPHGGQ